MRLFCRSQVLNAQRKLREKKENSSTHSSRDNTMNGHRILHYLLTVFPLLYTVYIYNINAKPPPPPPVY